MSGGGSALVLQAYSLWVPQLCIHAGLLDLYLAEQSVQQPLSSSAVIGQLAACVVHADTACTKLHALYIQHQTAMLSTEHQVCTFARQVPACCFLCLQTAEPHRLAVSRRRSEAAACSRSRAASRSLAHDSRRAISLASLCTPTPCEAGIQVGMEALVNDCWS